MYEAYAEEAWPGFQKMSHERKRVLLSQESDHHAAANVNIRLVDRQLDEAWKLRHGSPSAYLAAAEQAGELADILYGEKVRGSYSLCSWVAYKSMLISANAARQHGRFTEAQFLFEAASVQTKRREFDLTPDRLTWTYSILSYLRCDQRKHNATRILSEAHARAALAAGDREGYEWAQITNAEANFADCTVDRFATGCEVLADTFCGTSSPEIGLACLHNLSYWISLSGQHVAAESLQRWGEELYQRLATPSSWITAPGSSAGSPS